MVIRLHFPKAIVFGFLVLIAGCATPGERNPTQVLACMPNAEAHQIMNTRPTWIGLSEYDVLKKLGKPPRLMMSGRSEKLFFYPVCGDTARLVTVRFSGLGRVKEVYW